MKRVPPRIRFFLNDHPVLFYILFFILLFLLVLPLIIAGLNQVKPSNNSDTTNGAIVFPPWSI